MKGMGNARRRVRRSLLDLEGVEKVARKEAWRCCVASSLVVALDYCMASVLVDASKITVLSRAFLLIARGREGTC